MAAGGKVFDGRQIHIRQRRVMIFGVFDGGRGGGNFSCLRRVMRRDAAHVVVNFRQRAGEVFENGVLVRKDVSVMIAAGQRRLMLAVSVKA